MILTNRAVESIVKMDDFNKSGSVIVIVDNFSNNGTGEALLKQYAQHENIKVLLSGENGGFAKGNNFNKTF